jgi:hypothetical protein
MSRGARLKREAVLGADPGLLSAGHAPDRPEQFVIELDRGGRSILLAVAAA